MVQAQQFQVKLRLLVKVGDAQRAENFDYWYKNEKNLDFKDQTGNLLLRFLNTLKGTLQNEVASIRANFAGFDETDAILSL